MREFEMAADMWPCAVCGWMASDGSHAHHVVYRQHCPPGMDWDIRNALPICMICHEAHHNGSRRILIDRLSEANLEFAREVLGEAWEGYLARRYSGGPPLTAA